MTNSYKTKVDIPGFAGEGEGPEYETIYAMGSNCMVDNLAAITNWRPSPKDTIIRKGFYKPELHVYG